MNQLTSFIKRVSTILDKLAGLCIFFSMLLVITNIILRVALKHPILGTYEIVGFLTAMGVGFALANCAFQNGHIAVSFIMDRLAPKIQSIIDILVHGISLIFWTGAGWAILRFGESMKLKGLVSPSAEIPVYPFINLVALGILGLCLILIFKLVMSVREYNHRADIVKRVGQ